MHFSSLFLLNGFALAQPIFALLETYPEFLSAHRLQPPELILLVLALCTALPATGAIAGIAVRRISRTAAEAAGALLVGVLTALAVLPPLLAAGGAAMPIAIAIGGAAGLVCYRSERVRAGLRFASPLALIFPLHFVMSDAVLETIGAPRPRGWRLAPAVFRGPPIDSPTTVVLLSFDELPGVSLLDGDGEIDAERYPNFAALADESYWFRNGTTVASETARALGSLITGSDFGRKPWPTFRSEGRTLYRLLENGRGVRAYEFMNSLLPPKLSKTGESNPGLRSRTTRLLRDVAVLYGHLVMIEPWAEALPRIDQRWTGFGEQDTLPPPDPEMPGEHLEAWSELAGRTPARLHLLLDALRAIHDGHRPTLLYLHLLMPHSPWQYYPSGRAYRPGATPGRLEDGYRTDSEWDSVQAQQQHLLQVGYADVLLGLLISELREVGLYDEALLIVVADHGVSFEPGEHYRGLGTGNFAEVLSVPMFIKRPGQQEGIRSLRNVETIDVVPTIAEVLRIDIPWEPQGQSVFSKDEARASKTGDAPKWSFSPAEFEQSHDRVVARNHERFGAGLFKIAPEPSQTQLIGRVAADLDPRSLQEPRTVEIADLEAFDSVGSSHLFPGRVRGRIRSAEESPTPLDLAIALNGTIEAVTRTFLTEEGEQRWTALLPERALRNGTNQIAIFELIPIADGFELLATTLVSEQ